MTKTANKRKVNMPAGIRNKLMAAVSMLMVSAIMLVSTTYAWFTLSTAPEVTGITTNVGANGNLEMMLLDESSYASQEENLGVESRVGDSSTIQGVVAANKTWGNLVDLSDSTYGLDGIVLTPAKLTLDKDTGTVGTSMLYAPSYGTDGRVISVNTATYFGKRSGTQWIYDTNTAGVRAIGTTSGVTQRMASYRTAKAAVTTKMAAATNAARNSLIDNGQELANILVAHVQDSTSTYTRDQVTSLQNVINALKDANTKAGDAIKSAVLAYNLSQAGPATLSDTAVTNLSNAIVAVTDLTTLSSVTYDNDTEGGGATTIEMPSGAAESIVQWSANENALASANTLMESLLSAGHSDNYQYDEISAVVDKLINKEYTTIGGVKNPSSSNIGAMADYYVQHQVMDVVMGEDATGANTAGIYADIAKLVGNYTATGLTISIVYNGSTINAPANMSTAVSTSGTIISMITIGDEPTEGAPTDTTVLADTFGYALDFGFRTNAATSDLLLQTAAMQRVYSDSAAVNTQGSGSYMEFTTANPSTFTTDEVRALMSAIRIAFVEPGQTGGLYKMLGLAALDITATTDAATGITTYEGGTVTGNTVKANVHLFDYTQDRDSNIILGTKKADQSTITSLTQNVAKKITVIVYLDGNIVDNTMVANAVTSMSGSLNLQFSSNATLQAMENTGMRNGGTGGTPITVTYTQKATAGQSYTFGDITGNVKDDYTIYEGSDGEFYYSTDSTNYVKMTLTNYIDAITVN